MSPALPFAIYSPSLHLIDSKQQALDRGRGPRKLEILRMRVVLSMASFGDVVTRDLFSREYRRQGLSFEHPIDLYSKLSVEQDESTLG
jgi:hypothetical protein